MPCARRPVKFWFLILVLFLNHRFAIHPFHVHKKYGIPHPNYHYFLGNFLELGGNVRSVCITFWYLE